MWMIPHREEAVPSAQNQGRRMLHWMAMFKLVWFRLINVTGAGYADCDGLYSISNMSSIWDNKRIVYERVAGGWRPMDKRLDSISSNFDQTICDKVEQ